MFFAGKQPAVYDVMTFSGQGHVGTKFELSTTFAGSPMNDGHCNSCDTHCPLDLSENIEKGKTGCLFWLCLLPSDCVDVLHCFMLICILLSLLFKLSFSRTI